MVKIILIDGTLLNDLQNNAERIIVASRSKNILLRILNALHLFVTYILTYKFW